MQAAPRIALTAGLMVGALFAVLAALPRMLATRDLDFQGRPLEGWIADLNSTVPGTSNSVARVASTVIVPRLLGIVRNDTNDSPAKLTLIEALDSLPGVHVEFVPADGRRALALKDLAKLGPAGISAVPELITLLGSDDERLVGNAAAALASVNCDPAVAVPALIPALVRPDGHGRPDVVEALAKFGTKARAAVPALEKLEGDFSSKEIRVAVPRALQEIDPDRSARTANRMPHPPP